MIRGIFWRNCWPPSDIFKQDTQLIAGHGADRDIREFLAGKWSSCRGRGPVRTGAVRPGERVIIIIRFNRLFGFRHVYGSA